MQNYSVISIIPFVKCLLLDKPAFLLLQTTVPEILRAYNNIWKRTGFFLFPQTLLPVNIKLEVHLHARL